MKVWAILDGHKPLLFAANSRSQRPKTGDQQTAQRLDAAKQAEQRHSHSARDAMRYWPETATAVAARRGGRDELEIASPLGLDDLFNLLLRPTERFANE